jgi:GT2 family glycosyltransferase
MNNAAAKLAKGPLLGFLNNDLEVIEPEWLTEMVRFACRPEIGIVGAKLYYPNDTVQHAGVVLGIGGVAGHAHRLVRRSEGGYMARALLIQGFSAVTAACLLTRKTVFESVGGFEETHLAVAFNDVDFCLKVRELGLRVVMTPYAELYHLESASRGSDTSEANRPRFVREIEFMQKKWGHQLLEDPFYNPNLTLFGENYGLAFPPRHE